VTDQPDEPPDVRSALLAPLGPLDDVVAALPRAPGLVAWWGSVDVLPGVAGAAHPSAPGYRLLLVGAATMLRNRVTRQDLHRAGVSPLRQALAGLLLDDLGLAPTWAAEVVLPRADEERLTAWMRAHLRLSWCECADRAERLPALAAALGPGLDPDQEPARSAIARYVVAAGEKGERVIGVPFRRP
jgi:hypothetical protein